MVFDEERGLRAEDVCLEDAGGKAEKGLLFKYERQAVLKEVRKA